MLRSNKVILVSHCILNQNAVVHSLARSPGAFKSIIELLMDSGFGIVQLSCPETLMYGMSRPPMTKAEYDTPEYHLLCNTLATHDFEIIERFKAGNIVVSGIVGIDQSPTCSQIKEQGHFMAALSQIDAISCLPKIDIPESYEVGTPDADTFHTHFKMWLDNL